MGQARGYHYPASLSSHLPYFRTFPTPPPSVIECSHAQLDADSSVAAGTRCLESVVRRFGGFVRSTLGASVAAGRVDLAREERMGRCREAHRVSEEDMDDECYDGGGVPAPIFS